MPKLAWTHTAHRTYMSQTVKDGKGKIYFVIKGIDDLFFVYAKRPDNPVVQHGYCHRLIDAKQAVQSAVDETYKAKVSA